MAVLGFTAAGAASRSRLAFGMLCKQHRHVLALDTNCQHTCAALLRLARWLAFNEALAIGSIFFLRAYK